MSGVSMLFMHSASVETFTGTTPTGSSYAAPVTVAGLLDDQEQLTAEAGGLQLVGRTTFYTDLDSADFFTPRSRVTCNGRALVVQSVRRLDGGSVLGSVSHAAVVLS